MSRKRKVENVDKPLFSWNPFEILDVFDVIRGFLTTLDYIHSGVVFNKSGHLKVLPDVMRALIRRKPKYDHLYGIVCQFGPNRFPSMMVSIAINFWSFPERVVYFLKRQDCDEFEPLMSWNNQGVLESLIPMPNYFKTSTSASNWISTQVANDLVLFQLIHSIAESCFVPYYEKQ
jgi:hypothetical protein